MDHDYSIGLDGLKVLDLLFGLNKGMGGELGSIERGKRKFLIEYHGGEGAGEGMDGEGMVGEGDRIASGGDFRDRGSGGWR